MKSGRGHMTTKTRYLLRPLRCSCWRPWLQRDDGGARKPRPGGHLTVNSVADTTGPTESARLGKRSPPPTPTRLRGRPPESARLALRRRRHKHWITGMVNLSGALPDLSSNLVIEGPGADQFTVRRTPGAAIGYSRLRVAAWSPSSRSPSRAGTSLSAPAAASSTTGAP